MKLEKHLNNGNKIILNVDNNCCTISKGYFKNDMLEKSITLSIWDDFSFEGYIENTKDISELSFEFDIDDPLYFCLNRLLSTCDELLIDDDDTYQKNQKYMKIIKNNDNIIITFVNNLVDYKEYGKFNIFIKNIFDDDRSKIKSSDIKDKLVKFFKEAEMVLSEEYHQVTVDEYVERLNHSKKKVLKLK